MTESRRGPEGPRACFLLCTPADRPAPRLVTLTTNWIMSSASARGEGRGCRHSQSRDDKRRLLEMASIGLDYWNLGRCPWTENTPASGTDKSGVRHAHLVCRKPPRERAVRRLRHKVVARWSTHDSRVSCETPGWPQQSPLTDTQAHPQATRKVRNDDRLSLWLARAVTAIARHVTAYHA
jgi:hypothetical protein